MSEENNNMKNNISLANIRSKYILKQILNNFKEHKLLQTTHHIKKYQSIMNKNIDNYKREYNRISIEIIPAKNKYGRFIHFHKKAQSNFHLFFNDDTNEIKKNIITKDNKVKKIKIIIEPERKHLSSLFLNCKCIEKINFIRFKRKDIKFMERMFYDCNSLKELNISNLNINNVVNMSSMFYGCSSLKEINLTDLNTNNVTDMSGLFNYFESLKKINLSNLNTTKVKDMSYLFYNCSSLETIILENFNTNRVRNMNEMFAGYSSLKKINLSSFNTNEVTHMSYMFYECSSLKTLNPKWNLYSLNVHH